MLDSGIKKKVEFPEEVEFSLTGSVLEVSGPNGKLSREFDLKGLKLKSEEGILIVESGSSRRKRRASVGTVISHINNMIQGVTEGFSSELKVVYSHFPISVNVEGDKVKIENFIGEEEPRVAKILGETEVKLDGDKIAVSGPDKEDVGQTAANIEQAAQVGGRDSRVFQDGVYIVRRPGK